MEGDMRRIVIDTLGGDFGCKPIALGVAEALLLNPNAEFVLSGDEKTLRGYFEAMHADFGRLSFLDTDDCIAGDEPPTCIFGAHERASMVLALEYLRDNSEACGMISAGNTGALMVGSIFKLGLFGGLKLPALSTALPCAGKNLVCLVDCGANMDCKPKDLARFALMGDVFMRSIQGLESPRIGLLSVGSERGKGNDLTKEAFKLIEALPLNFIGNVEGGAVVDGSVDVIVADGFAGNIILKNTEAAGKRAMALVSAVQNGGSEAELELIGRIRERLYRSFDFNSQGGATFLGTKKIVVKAHGSATEKTIAACVSQLLRLESRGFIQKLRESLTV